MQLSPKSSIPTAWTASIPTDTTLYYVRAVLRNTATSATIQTVNLTRVSATPNRYVGTFSPVSDPSGLGLPVDITVSVYEDSGYTTLSTNYQILQTSYVVLQPFIANLGNGGGGSNISYEKIAAVVAEVLEGKSTEGDDEESPEEVAEKIDYGRIDAGFDSIVKANQESLPVFAEDIKARVDKMEEVIKGHGNDSAADRQRLAEELQRAIRALPANVDALMAGMEERLVAYIEKQVKGIKIPAPIEPRLSEQTNPVREIPRLYARQKVGRQLFGIDLEEKESEDAYDPTNIARNLF